MQFQFGEGLIHVFVFLVYHHRFAPSIRKEFVLMEADADINMLSLLSPNLPLHLRRQVLSNLLILILHIRLILPVRHRVGLL